MRAAITYINEYYDTQATVAQDSNNSDALWTRLRIIFGCVNNIKEAIDKAFRVDDVYRRRQNMRDVPTIKRFPSPQIMNQASSTVWVTWIREETNIVMMMLDEEVTQEGDPDNPFNGTARGVFRLPPGRSNSLSLPPPVHTPTTTRTSVGGQQRHVEGDEHSTHSQTTQESNQERVQPLEPINVRKEQPQSGEGDEHSTHSPDSNHTIRQLHNQQKKNRLEQEEADQVVEQERNLITFTPTLPNSVQGRSPIGTSSTPGAGMNQTNQNQQTPKPQRTQRNR